METIPKSKIEISFDRLLATRDRIPLSLGSQTSIMIRFPSSAAARLSVIFAIATLTMFSPAHGGIRWVGASISYNRSQSEDRNPGAVTTVTDSANVDLEANEDFSSPVHVPHEEISTWQSGERAKDINTRLDVGTNLGGGLLTSSHGVTCSAPLLRFPDNGQEITHEWIASIDSAATFFLEVYENAECVEFAISAYADDGSGASSSTVTLQIDGLGNDAIFSPPPPGDPLPAATNEFETARTNFAENVSVILEPGTYRITSNISATAEAGLLPEDEHTFPSAGSYDLHSQRLSAKASVSISIVESAIIPAAEVILNHIDHLDTITLNIKYDGLPDASSLDSKDLTIVSHSTPTVEYAVKYLGTLDGADPIEALYEIPVRGFPAGELDVRFGEDEVGSPETGFMCVKEIGPLLYCPKLLPRRSPPALGELDPALKAAVEEFRKAITTEPGSPTFKVTSGVRDDSYQGYLYQMRTAYLALAMLPDVDSYIVPVDNERLNKIRAQLGYRSTALCQSTIDELNARIWDHSIGVSSRWDGPGVNPPGASDHSTGHAVDISIGGKITPARISEIGLNLSPTPLCQTVKSEPHHFELCGSTPQGTALQINGNSPINILVAASDGRRIGHDPELGVAVNEWPGAEYSGSNVEPQWIALPNEPLNTTRELSITGIGTGSGSYTISISGYENFSDIGSDNALFKEVLSSGFASPGAMIEPTSRDFLASPPSAVQIERYGRSGIKMSYLGTLEESIDLVNWSAVVPQPPSPFFLNTEEPGKFWRVRME